MAMAQTEQSLIPHIAPASVVHWYFDFISPFAYLQSKRLKELPVSDIEFQPVLFAGLLKHWGNLGPAEISPKRRFTYRYVVWSAQRHDIPLQVPPAHPFNPLKVLRLCLGLGSSPDVVTKIFDFIWQQGRDPNQDWPLLCAELGISVDDAEQLISSEQVKQRLRQNTELAINAGVYGVPTLSINSENFWGVDATDMAADYLCNPQAFESSEMQRVSDLPIASERPRD